MLKAVIAWPTCRYSRFSSFAASTEVRLVAAFSVAVTPVTRWPP
jgi:hypothetical protein